MDMAIFDLHALPLDTGSNQPMTDTIKTSTRGRHRVVKAWNTRLQHAFRTDYELDSATHVLVFLAGDNVSKLLSAALRNFAELNCLPVDDSAFQHAVFMQAARIQAANKRAPLPAEVVKALGREDVLDILNRALGKDANAIEQAALQPVPYTPPVPTPVQQWSLPPLPSQAPDQPQPLPAPAPSPRKPMPEIDTGPEIELDATPVAPVDTALDATKALKNRWLAAHNY